MSSKIDILQLSGAKVATLDVKPSWTGEALFSALAEAIPWGTKIQSLCTLDGQKLYAHRKVRDLGLEDGSQLTLMLQRSLIPGVYQGHFMSKGPRRVGLDGYPGASYLQTSYRLEFAEDGCFKLKREVERRSNNAVTWKPVLEPREFSGHLSGTGAFVFEGDAAGISMRLGDDEHAATLLGLVEEALAGEEVGYGQVATKIISMKQVACSLKPERLTDLPGLMPPTQAVDFHPADVNGSGYTMEVQKDGSFKLNRREIKGWRTDQRFTMSGRFDETESQYTLDLDSAPWARHAWTGLRIYIGDGGKVMLDGRRGLVHEQGSDDGCTEKTITHCLSIFR